eukprot:1143858-Pelagomonas_calceolata.AAC.2
MNRKRRARKKISICIKGYKASKNEAKTGQALLSVDIALNFCRMNASALAPTRGGGLLVHYIIIVAFQLLDTDLKAQIAIG